MNTITDIPINIWDDFYDDGYVPEGEVTKSFVYVEDTDISHDKRKEYLEIFLEYLNNNLNTDGMKIWLSLFEGKKKYPNLVGTDMEQYLYDRWEIRIEGITHKMLHEWMDTLKDVKLEADNIPFRFYSES